MVSRALQLFQELCTSIVLSPPQPCLVHNKGDKVQTFFRPFVTFAPLSNWYCETIVLSHGWFFFFDFGPYATLLYLCIGYYSFLLFSFDNMTTEASNPFKFNVDFDGTNFLFWSQSLATVLKGKNLWKTVTGETKKPTVADKIAE